MSDTSKPLNPYPYKLTGASGDPDIEVKDVVFENTNELLEVLRKTVREREGLQTESLRLLVAAFSRLDHALSNAEKGYIPDDWAKGRTGYCPVCQKAPRVMHREGECDICYTLRQPAADSA